MSWDHPRACGAHQPIRQSHLIRPGSSPRMRGSHLEKQFTNPHRGIIPAHAGLTKTICPHLWGDGDHPRACGAHPCPFDSPSMSAGSSPRMRGSRRETELLGRRRGIIPAHAGLTRPPRGHTHAGWDHPRACGAHTSARAGGMSLTGSSPRMRGSPSRVCWRMQPLGIIPAHAGLTTVLPMASACRRDHPRACGAHYHIAEKVCGSMGSSPRMRGSLWCQRLAGPAAGIIPAHAGLTYQMKALEHTRRDHPRACGAHRPAPERRRAARGSSPRMRGSLCPAEGQALLIGIIPAHAGLTLKNPNIDAILSGPHPIFYSVLRVIR